MPIRKSTSKNVCKTNIQNERKFREFIPYDTYVHLHTPAYRSKYLSEVGVNTRRVYQKKCISIKTTRILLLACRKFKYFSALGC